MTDKTFTLDALCALSQLSKRTVRYYMQIGLVDRPVGETRAAHYSARQLDQLLRVKQLADAGVALERIREVLQGTPPPLPPRPRRPGAIAVRSHIHICPGVELQIDPESAGLRPEQLRVFVQDVLRAAHQALAVPAPPLATSADPVVTTAPSTAPRRIRVT